MHTSDTSAEQILVYVLFSVPRNPNLTLLRITPLYPPKKLFDTATFSLSLLPIIIQILFNIMIVIILFLSFVFFNIQQPLVPSRHSLDLATTP